MSEMVTYSATGPDPTGGRLVAWASAATAAHQLALALVRTAIVPEAYRARDHADLEQAAANAAAAILLGDELGLSPIAALRSVYVIKGQPAMYTRTMVALVLSRGHRVWTEHESAESVTVAGHRVGDPEHVERSTWTITRARAEGYTRNGNYRDHPAAMLYARAAADVARRVAPDVLLGVPETPAEELGPVLPSERVADTPDGARVVRRAAPSRTGGHEGATTAARISVHSPGVPSGEPTDENTPQTPPSAPVSAEKPSAGPPTPDADSVPADGDEGPAEPEPDVETSEPLIESRQRAAMHAGFRALGLAREGPNGYIAVAARMVGRPLATTNELTVTEASYVLDRIAERQARLAPKPGEAAAEAVGDEPDVDYRGGAS